MKGVRTTWGSKDFENRVIDEDAEVVVRLRNAGAVLIAKLATGLFAQGDQWYRGRTNNPWDIRRGSSGSSAGPSSATAAGCVAFGIGTETSGSIVSPSRECGLSALRPTFGRVSRLRRNGAGVVAGSRRSALPHDRRLRDGLQHDPRRRSEGSGHGHDAVPFRPQRQARVDAHRHRRQRAEGIRRQAARARRVAEGDRRAAARRRRRTRRRVVGGVRLVRADGRRRSSASISRRFPSRRVAAVAAAEEGEAAAEDAARRAIR